MNFRLEPKSSSGYASVGIQPASHHRPSFYDPTLVRPSSSKGCSIRSPPAKHVDVESAPVTAGHRAGTASSASFNQGFPSSMLTGNTLGIPLFGGSKQQAVAKFQFATAALKPAATVPAGGTVREHMSCFR